MGNREERGKGREIKREKMGIREGGKEVQREGRMKEVKR